MVHTTHVIVINVIILFLHSLHTSSDFRVHGGSSLTEESNEQLAVIKLKVNLKGSKVMKICTGSILNSSWIVSAAHCFRYKYIESVDVEVYRNGKFEEIGEVTGFKIKIHPKYNEDDSIISAKHDVALLYLNMKIRRFIELADELPKVGQRATIVGFGGTKFKSGPNGGEVVIQRTMKVICTVGSIWGSHGDSGGALLLEGRLVGVISRRKCKKRQCITYYADVYSNLIWIQHLTNKSV